MASPAFAFFIGTRAGILRGLSVGEWNMRALFALALGFALLLGDVSFACGFHGGCGGPGLIGPRPLLVGGGAVAFRRSNRLAFRAQRAAFRGFPGRAARLQFRSDLAFGRGLRRNARFNGF